MIAWRRWSWSGWMLLAGLAACAVGGSALMIPGPSRVVTAWRVELEQLDDATAVRRLRTLSPADASSLSLWVAALASERIPIAREASRLLSEWIWQGTTGDTPSQEHRLLIEELDRQLEQFPPLRHRAVGELISLILSQPEKGASPQREPLWLACQRLLERLNDEPEPPFTALSLGGDDPQLAQPASQRPSPSGSASGYPPLPVEPAPNVEPEPIVLRAPTTISPPSGTTSETPSFALTPPPASIEARTESDTFAAPRLLPAYRAGNEPPLWDVLQQLHDDESTVRRAAQQTLVQRGISPRLIALGEALASPDANVRRRAVEALPGLAPVDAKPWLLWLSHDPEPDVRQAVLAIMATSGDPELVRRVATMAVDDPDAGLRTLAKRIQAGVGGLQR